MNMEMPDMDKEYPTFLDLVIDAGKYGFAEISEISKDRNGNTKTGNDQLIVSLLSIEFFKYLVEVQGNGNPTSEKELEQLWEMKGYLTLNHLLNARIAAKKSLYEDAKTHQQKKSFLDAEFEKRLKESLPKTTKKSIDDFSAEEMGLYLFFQDNFPVRGQDFYIECNKYRKKGNRQYSKPKGSKFLIERFQVVIPFISNPEKRLLAEKELVDLKTRYYEETGIKIK